MQKIFYVLLVVSIVNQVISHPLEDDSVEEERSKRSLFTDPGVSLTGMEKISKRSVPQQDDDMDTAATNAFLPAFARRRGRRSADLEDLNTAENVFLPAFASRIYRGRRDVNQDEEDLNTAASSTVFIPAFARRNLRRTRRSVEENNDQDDLDRAETNAFLPAFARRNFRRTRRSADLEDADLDAEETHAFLPAFARRNRGKRSVELNDDLEPAATNAFLPGFARRNIRRG